MLRQFDAQLVQEPINAGTVVFVQPIDMLAAWLIADRYDVGRQGIIGLIVAAVQRYRDLRDPRLSNEVPESNDAKL